MNDRQWHIAATVTEPAALDWLAPSPRAGAEPVAPSRVLVVLIASVTAVLIGALAVGLLA